MIVRFLSILALASALSACAIKPPLDQAVAGSLRVAEVSVKVSGGQDELQHHGFTASMLQHDLTETLTRELLAVSEGGTTPVNVSVDVMRVSFTSVLPGIMRGSYPYSSIVAKVRITDATTGVIILFDREMRGNDNLAAHDLSAALIMLKPPQESAKVYRDLVAGFSADLRRQLFEWKGFSTAVN